MNISKSLVALLKYDNELISNFTLDKINSENNRWKITYKINYNNNLKIDYLVFELI